MKGMLIKDFRILKYQGKTLFLMLLVVAVLMNLITIIPFVEILMDLLVWVRQWRSSP